MPCLQHKELENEIVDKPLEYSGVIVSRVSDEVNLDLSNSGYENESGISVRIANTLEDREIAAAFLNRLFDYRGYGKHHKLYDRSANTLFIANDGSDMIGTITLAIDSDAGLSVDATFQGEIDRFRKKPGSEICELTKFAFETSKPSMAALAAVFHLIFIYGYRRYKCTDLFIEVNPRHVAFYRSMLGFFPIGSVKQNCSVNAPSQLMHLKVCEARSNILSHGEFYKNKNIRSLYRYFFRVKNEDEVYHSLINHRSVFAELSGI